MLSCYNFVLRLLAKDIVMFFIYITVIVGCGSTGLAFHSHLKTEYICSYNLRCRSINISLYIYINIQINTIIYIYIFLIVARYAARIISIEGIYIYIYTVHFSTLVFSNGTQQWHNFAQRRENGYIKRYVLMQYTYIYMSYCLQFVKKCGVHQCGV